MTDGGKEKADFWEWGYRFDLFINYLWPFLKPALPSMGLLGAAFLKARAHAGPAEVFLFGFFGVAAGLLVLLAIGQLRRMATGRAEKSQPKREDLQLPSTTAAIDAFYRTYDNRLLAETEEGLNAQASAFPEGHDRERFLVRSYATFVIAGIFEYTWVLIFGSQLRALHFVNAGPKPIEDLRPFYDQAVAHNQHLVNYPFTSWLTFMKSYTLIREDDGLIGITIRGREFLKYLVETGKSALERPN